MIVSKMEINPIQWNYIQSGLNMYMYTTYWYVEGDNENGIKLLCLGKFCFKRLYLLLKIIDKPHYVLNEVHSLCK